MSELEKFTELERKQLEQALGDAFTTYTQGCEHTEFDVSDIFPNQLWNSKVKTTSSMLEAYEEMKAGYPDEPIDELFIEALEDHEIDDAPKWWEVNPFNFNYRSLKGYFSEKFVAHSKEVGKYYSELLEHLKNNPEDFDDNDNIEWQLVGDLYRNAPVYSRKWFELKIYEQFLAIEDESMAKYVEWKFKQFGELGRMIEHYRWKFSFENDVQQGQKNEKARKAADDAKPQKAAEREKITLKCIARLWHQASQQLGRGSMRKDTNASVAIYAIAEKEHPIELLVKSTGKLKGPDTIRRYLPKLRALGKID